MKRLFRIFAIILFLTSLIFAGYGVTDEDLRNEVVTYHPFDEGTGTTAYDIAFGNDGIINGATWTNAGQINNALDFDGIDDYVDLPDGSLPIAENSDFTLSAWVNINDLESGGNGIAVARNGFYTAGLGYSNENLRWFLRDGSNTNLGYDLSGKNSNQWYHMTGVWQGTTGEYYFYLDGELVNSSSGWDGTLLDVALTQYDLIGARTTSGSNVFNGKIDEVSTWSKALTQTEITELYNRQLNNLSGAQYNFTSIPSLDITVNNPIDDFNYTYDVEEILLNISTNINTTNCNYTYNNVTNSMTQINNTQFEDLFDMGVANESKQEFNIEFSCFEDTYNTTDTQNVTFYRDQVPLELQIFVPEDEQEFSRETNQIEFYIETNYQATCSYLVYNMTSYESFNLTNGAIHKTNYSAFYPNISQYNTSFECDGVIVNETIIKNITFYLVDEEVVDSGRFEELNNTTSGIMGTIDIIIEEIKNLLVNQIIIIPVLIAFVLIVSSLLSLLYSYFEDVFKNIFKKL